MTMIGCIETIDYRDGCLCVKHTSTGFIDPVRYTHWWPIMWTARANVDEVIGLKAESGDGSGRYAVKVGVGFAGYWRNFTLKDGGSTKPIHTETAPEPCPKVRKGIETRWNSGRWQKYLKSQGWVDA